MVCRARHSLSSRSAKRGASVSPSFLRHASSASARSIRDRHEGDGSPRVRLRVTSPASSMVPARPRHARLGHPAHRRELAQAHGPACSRRMLSVRLLRGGGVVPGSAPAERVSARARHDDAFQVFARRSPRKYMPMSANIGNFRIEMKDRRSGTRMHLHVSSSSTPFPMAKGSARRNGDLRIGGRRGRPRSGGTGRRRGGAGDPEPTVEAAETAVAFGAPRRRSMSRRSRPRPAVR